MLALYDQVGSIEPGKLANFLVASGPVFKEKTIIYQNWVQGEQYDVKNEEWSEVKGIYSLSIHSANSTQNFQLEVKTPSSATITAKDTLQARFNFNGKMVNISFAPDKKSKLVIRLSGIATGNQWSGNGQDTDASAGNMVCYFFKRGAFKTR